MTMTRSESGKLGAQALNDDPCKKRAAAKKAAATRLAKDPNVFKKMGKRGGRNKHLNIKKGIIIDKRVRKNV